MDDVILLAPQGVSFTEVQEGLSVRRGVRALPLLVDYAWYTYHFPMNT